MTGKLAERAKDLLRRAASHQHRLENGDFAGQILPRTVPVLWFGNLQPACWVTIGTNPSSREFRDLHGRLYEPGRFFMRNADVTLDEYCASEGMLGCTLDSYNTYFDPPGRKRKGPYAGWFGRQCGGKLEGFLNGGGLSLYHVGPCTVVHMDFLSIATQEKFGSVPNRETLIDSSEAKEVFRGVLELIQPSGIIVLGSDNIERYRRIAIDRFAPDGTWNVEHTVPAYPLARYREASTKSGARLVGLHFKPSETGLALGVSPADRREVFGTYQCTKALRAMGKHILGNAGAKDVCSEQGAD